MGVEILILSGARQGEQLMLDADEFRAGGVDACDVFFDPSADTAAMGRIALFRRNDEGWSIQSAGNGELLLNQETISGRTRIRSGDIVRLSDHGPDFSFEILAGRSPAWTNSPSGNEIPAPMQADDVLQSGVTAESNLAPISLPVRSSRRNIVIAAMAGVGVFTLVVLLAVGLFAPAADVEPPYSQSTKGATAGLSSFESGTPSENAAGQAGSENRKLPQNTAGQPSSDTKTTAAPHKDPTPKPANITPADPWTPIAEQYEKTVWLLEVSDPAVKFVYPFATAAAVGEHTLLTTAAVAAELQKFGDRGWKVWARNTALKKTVFIDKVRLHGLYVALGNDPQKKIYVDQGVLTTRQDLPSVAPMATADELVALDTGAELACIGISHEGDAVKPDDPRRQNEFLPQLIAGKLFLRTQFDPKSPSSPRLLHLKASQTANFPPNLYGSPIINRQGKIVAVYAEAAAIGAGNQLRLHYAAMIDPALIQLALIEPNPGGKDANYWVSANPATKNPATKNPATKNPATKKPSPKKVSNGSE